MELYKEILINMLANESVEVSFPNLQIDAQKIVETADYIALRNIKEIIHDSSLEDEDCFRKIEAIIVELEAIGSSGGFRHDF